MNSRCEYSRSAKSMVWTHTRARAHTHTHITATPARILVERARKHFERARKHFHVFLVLASSTGSASEEKLFVIYWVLASKTPNITFDGWRAPGRGVVLKRGQVRTLLQHLSLRWGIEATIFTAQLAAAHEQAQYLPLNAARKRAGSEDHIESIEDMMSAPGPCNMRSRLAKVGGWSDSKSAPRAESRCVLR